MNSDIKILFLHGKEGSPEGSKIAFLKGQGFRVIAPVLPKDDWALSIGRARDAFIHFRPDIVVGSSRGGAIASILDTSSIPKILIAPAYRHFYVENPLVDLTTTVLHCREDNIVFFRDSEKLKNDFGVNLVECGTSHRMSDEQALSELLKAVINLKNESR